MRQQRPQETAVVSCILVNCSIIRDLHVIYIGVGRGWRWEEREREREKRERVVINDIYRTEIKVRRVAVWLDSFRSWTLEEEEEEDFVTAAVFDCCCCRCEEEKASLTIRCSDVAAMSREDWKRSRLWRKIFVGLKRGRTKKERKSAVLWLDKETKQKNKNKIKNWPFCITQKACSYELPPDITKHVIK